MGRDGADRKAVRFTGPGTSGEQASGRPVAASPPVTEAVPSGPKGRAVLIAHELMAEQGGQRSAWLTPVEVSALEPPTSTNVALYQLADQHFHAKRQVTLLSG